MAYAYKSPDIQIANVSCCLVVLDSVTAVVQELQEQCKQDNGAQLVICDDTIQWYSCGARDAVRGCVFVLSEHFVASAECEAQLMHAIDQVSYTQFTLRDHEAFTLGCRRWCASVLSTRAVEMALLRCLFMACADDCN